MDFNTVIVKKNIDGYSSVKEALKELSLDINKLKNKKVLIKPNAGRLVDPCLGINTNPSIVAGVLDFLLEAGIKDICVGESPILGVKALESMEKCGISAVVRERNIPLIDLDSEPPVIKKIQQGKIIHQLKVCKKVTEAEYIISIPVIKTHMHTQVSLGLKNMKGCIFGREKVKLHQLAFPDKESRDYKPLDLAIADMAKILLPDLTVIDGTIGQEGLGPSAGEAKPTGLVIVSQNCLAADYVAAELMGFDPESIHHLRLAVEELKESNPACDFKINKIKIIPATYLQWETAYKEPPKKISFEYLNVIVDDKDSCSACLSTLLMFLKRYYQEYADYLTAENPLRFALGKSISEQVPGTLLVGNCTFKQKRDNIFIQGCPPVPSQIKKELDNLFPKGKKSR